MPNELEDQRPTILQATLHDYINKIFRKRSFTDSHCLRWGDITLSQDPRTNKEILIGNFSGLETQLSEYQLDSDDLQAQAVNCYKEFRGHRPTEMNTPNSPFFLAVKRKRREGDPVWYMERRQGLRKIGKRQ